VRFVLCSCNILLVYLRAELFLDIFSRINSEWNVCCQKIEMPQATSNTIAHDVGIDCEPISIFSLLYIIVGIVHDTDQVSTLLFLLMITTTQKIKCLLSILLLT
jgi:hypothetical protein